MPESIRIAHHPVTIPGLPDELEAFPVYRERTRDDGRKINSALLRLEIRAASPSATTTWSQRLAALDLKTREWLTKNRSGLAKTITRRFGEQTLELLYRWCADGIVVFSVKPPTGPNAPHGILIKWWLTQAVLDFVQNAERTSAAQQADQRDEARKLAEHLSTIPAGRQLSQILIKITDREYLPHALATARAVATAATAADVQSGQDTAPEPRNIVRQLARGNPKDYVLDRDRVGGGQAYVYAGHHKATGTLVAYKRLRIRDPDTIARMRREIEAGMLFGRHANVMPVLDADPDFSWFVMPLASSTARAKATELQEAPNQLVELLVAACEALRAPHEQGWIHRDLKPDNLLMLDNQWVVADWGLARRPRGATSEPARTRTGTGYGTEGFAAPELSLDAHGAGPQADIFSLGQIVGSILTGKSPQANIPLVPPSGPWTELVSRATQRDPAERPQSVGEFLDHLDFLSRTMQRSM